MNKAAFSLGEYKFEKVNIDYSIKTSNKLNIEFNPSGKFISNKSMFELTIKFSAYSGEVKEPFIEIDCIAFFKFENELKFEEIPSYFYANSLPIIFPYIRAFISTVTLQANVQPIVLPTMNLSSLESTLKENTVII